MNQDDNPTVYSSERGRLCPDCNQPIKQCRCLELNKSKVPTGDGVVRISLDTKGRKGKGVTLIKGLLLNALELEKMAKQLKKQCGSGGTVKEGVIEIQGDHRQFIMDKLQNQGFTVKQTGG